MVEFFLKWNSLVVRCSIADEYGIGHSVDHYQTAVYFDICLHCLLNLPVPTLRIFSCQFNQWDKNISCAVVRDFFSYPEFNDASVSNEACLSHRGVFCNLCQSVCHS